jgi:hypothetical protein
VRDDQRIASLRLQQVGHGHYPAAESIPTRALGFVTGHPRELQQPAPDQNRQTQIAGREWLKVRLAQKHRPLDRPGEHRLRRDEGALHIAADALGPREYVHFCRPDDGR